APGDRCPECLLARIGVPSASQQVEALRESFENLRWREGLRPRRGEFDGEREVVETVAELCDLRRRVEPRASTEERDSVRRRERRYRVLDLALHAQKLPARHQEREPGTSREERREVRGGLDHLLQVVEQEQHLSRADVLRESVPRPERLGNRFG